MPQAVIPQELKNLYYNFFAGHSHNFDLSTNEGCGTFTEAWVKFARSNGWDKVGHLKKTGGTNYNGHPNDAFLWGEKASNGLLSAVDIIGHAEAKPPYNSNNPAPEPAWQIDEARYTTDMWYAEPGVPTEPHKTVPWVGYNEEKFQFLKRQLAYDYARRPQGADFDVCVWAARTFHNAYFGPDGKPLGEQSGMERAQKEWCAALGVEVKPVPPNWNIGDPV